LKIGLFYQKYVLFTSKVATDVLKQKNVSYRLQYTNCTGCSSVG